MRKPSKRNARARIAAVRDCVAVHGSELQSQNTRRDRLRYGRREYSICSGYRPILNGNTSFPQAQQRDGRQRSRDARAVIIAIMTFNKERDRAACSSKSRCKPAQSTTDPATEWRFCIQRYAVGLPEFGRAAMTTSARRPALRALPVELTADAQVAVIAVKQGGLNKDDVIAPMFSTWGSVEIGG